MSGQPSITSRLEKAIVVRLGEKRLLRAAIRHAEELRAAEEAASETQIAKKRPREETKSTGGSGKRMKR